MLKSNKHVFWEAFLITIVIFILGILIGVSIESKRINQIEDYYTYSEISLMDVLALNSFMELDSWSCSEVIEVNLNFADNIYREAAILEKYSDSSRLSKSMDLEHKKYDLLRNFLWINSLRLFERCSENFTPIVYLYNYHEESLEKKAMQEVLSNVLEDLKEKKGSQVILLPIAIDNNLSSVDSMVAKFEIESFPAVVIGDKFIIYHLPSLDELENYLN
jgi:hypothetical protein